MSVQRYTNLFTQVTSFNTTLSTQTTNPPYQPTLLTHSINAPTQPFPLTHPPFPSSHPTLDPSTSLPHYRPPLILFPPGSTRGCGGTQDHTTGPIDLWHRHRQGHGINTFPLYMLVYTPSNTSISTNSINRCILRYTLSSNQHPPTPSNSPP